MDQPFRFVPLDKIKGVQVARGDKSDARLLSESLQKIGVLHAPIVAEEGSEFRLIAGAGRCNAAREAGIEKVWCYVFPHDADSPEARLAFFDENLMRVELPQAMRDEQWAARKKLVEQIDPSQKAEAKQRAGAKQGGKGKKKPATKSGAGKRKPSDEPDARQQSEAAHRVDGAAASTWELYAAGELGKSQVDALITIKDQQVQAEVARDSVGKGVAETKALVRAANQEAAAPGKSMKAAIAALTKVTKAAKQFNEAVSIAQDELDRLGEFSVAGVRETCAVLALTAEAAHRLGQRLTDKGGLYVVAGS